VKNTQARHVRNRTSSTNRPETPARSRDRRVQKTKASLHTALIGLAREKPYPSIVVKEILDRANVGRSTFYTHFRDKDDLLESGIYDVLRSLQDLPRRSSAPERLVAFSLPLLRHIDEHRRTAGPRMGREGRATMHAHMEDVLTTVIADQLATAMRVSRAETPMDLVARYVASTFVLVLNQWVENDTEWTPAEADARFRALAMPTLNSLFNP
jgi:AcrR family transcriptional regulator